MNPTTSLLDRANLDRDAVRHEVARGLSGADDGELFLEYSQTEALMFDNGRLKQATYDTSQGFGLRAVKDDAVGYAHSSDVSLPALIRAADAVSAVRGGYSGSFAAPLKREMEFEYAFVKAGGLLMTGADPTGNGGALAGFADQRNVELLVEAGFTPVEAIRAS